LDPKSHSCILVGYSEESKAYPLFDPIKQEIIIQHDVIFDEKTLGIILLICSYSVSSSNPMKILQTLESTGLNFGSTSLNLTLTSPHSKSTRAFAPISSQFFSIESIASQLSNDESTDNMV